MSRTGQVWMFACVALLAMQTVTALPGAGETEDPLGGEATAPSGPEEVVDILAAEATAGVADEAAADAVDEVTGRAAAGAAVEEPADAIQDAEGLAPDEETPLSEDVAPVLDDAEEAADDAADELDQATRCQKMVRYEKDYWQADIRDYRRRDAQVVGLATAEVIGIVTSSADLDDRIGSLLPGDVVQGPIKSEQIAVNVHASWEEDWIAWQRLTDVLVTTAPAGGGIPDDPANGTAEVVEVCDEEPSVGFFQDERYNPNGTQAYAERPDGWYINASTVGIHITDRSGASGLPRADARGVSGLPSVVQDHARKALDEHSVPVYRVVGQYGCRISACPASAMPFGGSGGAAGAPARSPPEHADGGGFAPVPSFGGDWTHDGKVKSGGPGGATTNTQGTNGLLLLVASTVASSALGLVLYRRLR